MPDTSCSSSLEPLLRPAQAAELLGVTESALEAWRRRGGGPPHVRVGRLPRYAPSALKSWIAARTYDSNAAEAD
jgi:predicted DNA-binding transcriptional regulator AlpA